MTALDDQPTLLHRTPGEQCTHCSAPLAADQRYCLNCGTRRAERRVPVAAASAAPLALPVASGAAGAPLVATAAPDRFGGVWGVAALLLVALGVGVVIGRSGQSEAPVAARPPVVNIAAGPTGPAAAAPAANAAPAADEWPDQDGFTVQLGELPKAGTDQAAADDAKAAATAKGASAPGVLDAGAHGLTAGQLVLYSGVFSTMKEATAALAGLKSAYPGARVIEVKSTSSAATGTTGGSSGAAAGPTAADQPEAVTKEQLEAKEKLSPDAFQKQSKKLPKTTAIPGKPPPKDNAPPGGGSEAETIG